MTMTWPMFAGISPALSGVEELESGRSAADGEARRARGAAAALADANSLALTEVRPRAQPIKRPSDATHQLTSQSRAPQRPAVSFLTNHTGPSNQTPLRRHLLAHRPMSSPKEASCQPTDQSHARLGPTPRWIS